MKIKTEIELAGHALRRWQKYQRVHSFLNAPDTLLVQALVESGLERWMEHHRQNEDHKAKGKHE